MPSAMTPATKGAELGSSRCSPELGAVDAAVAAGIGAPARSPATEPTGRSVSFAGSAVAATGSADWAVAGAAQRPSALTKSSAATAPCGPRFMLLVAGLAQSGLANMFADFENQPPSFWS